MKFKKYFAYSSLTNTHGCVDTRTRRTGVASGPSKPMCLANCSSNCTGTSHILDFWRLCASHSLDFLYKLSPGLFLVCLFVCFINDVGILESEHLALALKTLRGLGLTI